MRVGVVGLGRIGQMHARNLAQTEGVHEVVLIGRDAGRTSAAADEVRRALDPRAPAALAGRLAPGTGGADVVTTTAPLPSALAGLDAVVIATVTATHPELTLLAARAGTPTLVEKPLALEVDRLERLADEVDATGTPVAVAFHRRYDPGHRELRRRILDGDAGCLRVVHAVGHDRTALSLDYIPHSGGIWLDMLIHEFDTIPWVTGQRVKAVYATGAVLDQPAHEHYDDVDTAAAVLTLESGAVALVSGARRNDAGQDVRLEVFGSAGTFGVGVGAGTPVTSTDPGVPEPEPPYLQFIDRFEAAFRAEAAHFMQMAAGQAPNLTPARAGVDAVRIALAAAQSRRTGAPVDVLD